MKYSFVCQSIKKIVYNNEEKNSLARLKKGDFFFQPKQVDEIKKSKKMSNIKNIPFNLRVGTFRHIVCYIQTKNKHFFSKKKDFIFKNKNKVIDIFLYMNDV